jgi:hypothetical protein
MLTTQLSFGPTVTPWWCHASRLGASKRSLFTFSILANPLLHTRGPLLLDHVKFLRQHIPPPQVWGMIPIVHRICLLEFGAQLPSLLFTSHPNKSAPLFHRSSSSTFRSYALLHTFEFLRFVVVISFWWCQGCAPTIFFDFCNGSSDGFSWPCPRGNFLQIFLTTATRVSLLLTFHRILRTRLWSQLPVLAFTPSIPKLLSSLTFLFIFDHSSYSENFKIYHKFYYDLFY